MGGRCCSLASPCEGAEHRAEDMVAISLDVLARLQSSTKDAARDEKYLQRLADLQSTFALDHKLSPEEVAKEADRIRALCRPRKTLQGYLEARDALRACYERSSRCPLDCWPEAHALGVVADEAYRRSAAATAPRASRCCMTTGRALAAFEQGQAELLQQQPEQQPQQHPQKHPQQHPQQQRERPHPQHYEPHQRG